MGGQRFRRLGVHGSDHRTRQHVIRVGDGRHDTVANLVLQFEDVCLLLVAIERLCPEIDARARVRQLHCDAQLGSRLPQTAFHNIACARFLADRPDVDLLVGLARG
jgi:hypothetical protein